MAKIDFGKGLGLVRDALRSGQAELEKNVKKVQETLQSGDVDLGKGLEKVQDLFKQKEKPEQEEDGPVRIRSISTRSAIKIIYYLMAADGQAVQSEEEKLDAIGAELDPEFSAHKEKIISECQAQLDKVIEPEDFYDVLQDGIEDAISASRTTADTFITPKLLLWDLLTIAYSDEEYSENERRLVKYVVRKLDIDKAVYLELESSMLTLIDLEKELEWIKTTDRPCLKIEMMVNEIADRKNVIFESAKDLISL